MEKMSLYSDDQVDRVIHVIKQGQLLTRATTIDEIQSIYDNAIAPFVNQNSQGDYDVISELNIFMNNAIKTVELIKELTDRVEVFKHLSYRDSLTGLFNRRAFEELFERNDTCDMKNTAIIVGDVNRLKKINDLHGHMVGDSYLKAIAKVIIKNTEHHKVFRLGGDEFCIVVTNASDMSVAKMIHDIQRECAMLQVKSETLSIALGYAFSDDRCNTFSSLFACAESRMYKEKSNFHNVI